MVKGLEAFERIIETFYDKESEDIQIVRKELEVLSVIYNSPFIIDNLAELGKLPPEAKKRYLFGTITNADVEKVEEFFKDGEK